MNSTSVISTVMVLVECFRVGLVIMSKATMTRGTRGFAFVVYSNVIAVFFYRSCLQLCTYNGMGYSSATLASALFDFYPSFHILTRYFLEVSLFISGSTVYSCASQEGERKREGYSMAALLPFVGMVLRILAQVSNMVVCKAAMSGGLNQYVLILYSNALATLIFLSGSFLFHRTERPPITFSILWRIFLLALIGTASQICGYVGIKYSSPALGAAMLNLVPAFTFILSISFRMEKLDWRSNSSRAKALGTLVSITGAFVVTVYKGPPIMMKPSLNAPFHQLISSSQLNWIIGGVFLAVEALTGSAWYVAQAILLEEFSALFIVMFYQAFFGLILNAAYSLAMVKDPSAWKLTLDMGLFAVFYLAIVGIAFSNILVAWCLLRIGPLYVTMFKPLGIIFAVAMGIIFLGDVLCLGSLIGSIIIVIGFYSVMWGKAKEEKISKEDGVKTLKSSNEKVPFLQNKAEDVRNSAETRALQLNLQENQVRLGN